MTVLSRPMFNRGGMVHDERTIRNVDDEIYRIAPKTHSRGRERMDAREEYGRLLREKDYLRNEMNRMAKGGGVASFPDLSGDGKVTRKDILMGRGVIKKANGGGVMDMLPAPVAGELAAMEQQGMALGADMAMQQEAAIDSAEDPKQLIDAMRGNQLPLQERYNELATFVGPNDAAITPTSVLALTQPAIIMASEGAVDQGIGNLIEGMTGDVMMDDAMGAAPMGMGVGGANGRFTSPPVPMNTGGAVKKLQLGGDPSFDLGTQTQSTVSELQDLVGLTDEEQALQQAAIYANLADRAFAFAGNRDPRTGEALEGNLLEKAAQAGQGVMSDIVKARAPLAANQRQIRNIALQDALARRTMQEKAGYDLGAAIASAQVGGVSTNQLRGMLTQANLNKYATGRLTPNDNALIELAIESVKNYRQVPMQDPNTGLPYLDSQADPLPEYIQTAIDQRRELLDQGAGTGTPDPVPDSSRSSEFTEMDAPNYVQELIEKVPDKFGLEAAVVNIADQVRRVFGDTSPAMEDRAALTAALGGLNTRVLLAFLASPGVRTSSQVIDLFQQRLPTVTGVLEDPATAQAAYQDVLTDLTNGYNNLLAIYDDPVTQNNPQNRLAVEGDLRTMQTEIKSLQEVIQALSGATTLPTGSSPSTFPQSDVDQVREFVVE